VTTSIGLCPLAPVPGHDRWHAAWAAWQPRGRGACRAHAEISHQIRRLGQLLGDIGTEPPDDADVADLRALLYGLHAILRLHTAQEDDSYLSLADEAPAPQPPAQPALTSK
jgi:hypothetical protein